MPYTPQAEAAVPTEQTTHVMTDVSLFPLNHDRPGGAPLNRSITLGIRSPATLFQTRSAQSPIFLPKEHKVTTVPHWVPPSPGAGDKVCWGILSKHGHHAVTHAGTSVSSEQLCPRKSTAPHRPA